ncbi:MAG: hypothetical protein ACKO9I_23450 [Sphaerospermopsis kisseleviana]
MTGDWGLGTGDWGLGTGDWGLGEKFFIRFVLRVPCSLLTEKPGQAGSILTCIQVIIAV